MRSLIILTVVLLSRAAAAQVVNASTTTQHRHSVALFAGFDHGGVLEVSSAHALAVPRVPHAHLVGAIALPSSPTLGDGGATIGLAAGTVARSGWGVSPRALATVRWVQGSLLDVAQVGLLVGASAGWFHPRGYVTVDASWDKSVATHVSPTEMHLRDYPASGSGWYGSGGGVLRAGLAAGIDASERVVFALRAGFDSSEQLNMTPGLPLYAFLGGGARF